MLKVLNPSKQQYTIQNIVFNADGSVTINYTFVNPTNNQVSPGNVTLPANQPYAGVLMQAVKVGIEATFYEGMEAGM